MVNGKGDGKKVFVFRLVIQIVTTVVIVLGSWYALKGDVQARPTRIEIHESYVSKDVYELQMEYIKKSLDRIESKLETN